jgi:hypothetical protein
MTILERKMNRTTSKLIDQINKSADAVAQSADLGFDSSIQVCPAVPGENAGSRLKTAELRRMFLSKVNRAITKCKQSLSNKSAKGI